MTTEHDLWKQAALLTEIGIIPLAEPLSPADTLHELEKHQLWIEQHNASRPDQEPCPGTLTPADLAILGAMRSKYPSTEDGLWEGVLPQH